MARDVGDEMRAHRVRVANNIEDLYGDPVLTHAAKIHGIHVFVEHNELSEDAAKIVDDWKRIHDELRSARPKMIAARVSKGFRKPKKALALFVVEKFDHFDEASVSRDLNSKWREQSQFPEIEKLLLLRANVLSGVAEAVSENDEIERLRIYADIADNLGLVNHRDGFELMHWLAKNQPAREPLGQLGNYLNSKSEKSLISGFETVVNDKLTGEVALSVRAVWKWHPISSIFNQMMKENKFNILPVWTCGRLIIDIDRENDCYNVLALLCKSFDHQAQIDDTIKDLDRTGKAEISLMLLLRNQAGGAEPGILSRVGVLIRFRDPNSARYFPHRFLLNTADPSREKISVFTKDGDELELQGGAKLIDFAFSIHIELVAYIDHGIVNGKVEMDLMAPLRHGDKVQIVKRDAFRWPPNSWLVSISKESRSKIVSHLRKKLIGNGLKFFVEVYLRLIGFSYTNNEISELRGQLDQACEQHLRNIGKIRRCTELAKRSVEREGVFVDYFLFQLVVLHKDQLGWTGGNKSDFLIQDFEEIAKMIRGKLDFSNSAVSVSDKVVWFSPRYFVIVAKDRNGIVFDILQVFHRESAVMVEIAARTIHPERAYLRITTLAMSKTRVKSIRDNLKSKALIIQCLDDSMLPSEHEAPLPPRLTMQSSRFMQSVPTNRPIQERHYFYGRGNELAIIYREIRNATARGSNLGAAILIRGPLKVGKTSLAMQVVLSAQLGEHGSQVAQMPRIIVTLRGGPKTTIGLLEEHIVAQAGAQWTKFCVDCGLPAQSAPVSLAGLCTTLKGLPTGCRPMVLVLLDEVMELFRSADSDSDAFEFQFREFSNCFQSTPGMVLLAVGPTLPTRWLRYQLQNVLTSFETVEIVGLAQDETRAMLNRLNLKSIGPTGFVMDDLSCNRIHHETAGNPFWVAHLTNAAIDLVVKRNLAAVTDELVVELLDDLAVNHDDLFMDRFMGFSHPGAGCSMQAFKSLLFKQVCAGSTVRMTKQMVAEEDARAGIKLPLCVSDAEELLDCLVDAGGLLKHKQYFELAAPILLRWLKQLCSRN